MYDYSKLLGRIREKCNSQIIFSEKMQLSERSMSLKLNGKREWKQSEIKKACEILEIKAEEISSYFFNAKVQY